MSRLDLCFINPVGTWGVCDMCLCGMRWCWEGVWVAGMGHGLGGRGGVMLLLAFQSMFISIWISRLEVAKFPDSVHWSAP